MFWAELRELLSYPDPTTFREILSLINTLEGVDLVTALHYTNLQLEDWKLGNFPILTDLDLRKTATFLTRKLTCRGPWEYHKDMAEMVPNLRELSYRRFPHRTLNPLVGLSHLKSLFLDIHNLRDLSALKDFPNLESLELYNNDTLQDEDLEPLRYLKKLQFLYIGRSLKLTSLNHIRSCKYLITIDCKGIPYLKDISALLELLNLREVDLEYTGIQENNLTVQILKERGVKVLTTERIFR